MTDAAMPETPETPAPRRCPGAKADGAPCDVPEQMLMPSGWCFSHDPTTRTQHKAAATLAGIKAGKRRRRGLDPDELGELETPADAMRWTKALALAVATGAVSSPQARTALVAIAAWQRAWEAHEDDLVERLQAEIARLKGGRT